MDVIDLPKQVALRKAAWVKWYAKNKRSLMKMDREILQLHLEAEADTNCLACGNCCRSLGPMILPDDVDRMGKALRIKPSAVIERYQRTDEDGDRVFRSMPSPILGDDYY